MSESLCIACSNNRSVRTKSSNLFDLLDGVLGGEINEMLSAN
jgi:hypothetical protein